MQILSAAIATERHTASTHNSYHNPQAHACTEGLMALLCMYLYHVPIRRKVYIPIFPGTVHSYTIYGHTHACYTMNHEILIVCAFTRNNLNSEEQQARSWKV